MILFTVGQIIQIYDVRGNYIGKGLVRKSLNMGHSYFIKFCEIIDQTDQITHPCSLSFIISKGQIFSFDGIFIDDQFKSWLYANIY